MSASKMWDSTRTTAGAARVAQKNFEQEFPPKEKIFDSHIELCGD